jgi:MFS family permease
MAQERGRKIGIWTVFVGLSPYVGTLLDGFVTVYAGWRWMQWLTFFLWCVLLVSCVVALPETLYDRHHNLVDIPSKKTYLQRLKWMSSPGRKLTFRSFWHPCTMFFYPSVIFPGFYYGTLYGFCVFGALGMLPFVRHLVDSEE